AGPARLSLPAGIAECSGGRPGTEDMNARVPERIRDPEVATQKLGPPRVRAAPRHFVQAEARVRRRETKLPLCGRTERRGIVRPWMSRAVARATNDPEQATV